MENALAHFEEAYKLFEAAFSLAKKHSDVALELRKELGLIFVYVHSCCIGHISSDKDVVDSIYKLLEKDETIIRLLQCALTRVNDAISELESALEYAKELKQMIEEQLRKN